MQASHLCVRLFECVQRIEWFIFFVVCESNVNSTHRLKATLHRDTALHWEEEKKNCSMNTHCSDRALEMKGRHSWPIMRIDILHLPVCYFFEIKVTKRQSEKSSERKRIFLYSVTYFDHSKSNLHSYNLLKVHWVHSSPVENDISILKTATEVSLDFDSMLQSIFNKRTTHRLTCTAHHSACAMYTDMCMFHASIDLSHNNNIQSQSVIG